MSDLLLKVTGLNKSFFGVQVLRDVGLELRRGAVLGLVGENGSGKSTTMNILGGVLTKDSGRVELAGEEVAPASSRDALALGIAFIHQELSLFPNLSVEENIFLDHFPRRLRGLPFIDRRQLRDQARKALELVDLQVSPVTPVMRLPQGERQLVEIAKALTRQARLIIFDEPTTSLTARETERLFEIIGRLRAQGISIIYISHILGDVMRLCDDIAVLRDGEVVGAGRREDFTIERLVTLMVGRTIDRLFPEREPSQRPSGAALTVRGLSQPGIVKDVSFDLNRGEVLGVSGLMGSGRSELARILFGLDPYSEGEIRIDDEKLPPLKPRAAMDKGVAFLTEDRRGEGLMMEASIADNIVLPSLVERSKGLIRWVNPAELDRGGARHSGAGPGQREINRDGGGAHSLRREPAEGRDREVASARALDFHSRRADARHRRRRQIRGLQDHQPDGRRGRRDPLHILRDRGADRHGRSHHGHGTWRDSRLLRPRELRPRNVDERGAMGLRTSP